MKTATKFDPTIGYAVETEGGGVTVFASLANAKKAAFECEPARINASRHCSLKNANSRVRFTMIDQSYAELCIAVIEATYGE